MLFCWIGSIPSLSLGFSFKIVGHSTRLFWFLGGRIPIGEIVVWMALLGAVWILWYIQSFSKSRCFNFSHYCWFALSLFPPAPPSRIFCYECTSIWMALCKCLAYKSKYRVSFIQTSVAFKRFWDRQKNTKTWQVSPLVSHCPQDELRVDGEDSVQLLVSRLQNSDTCLRDIQNDCERWTSDKETHSKTGTRHPPRQIVDGGAQRRNWLSVLVWKHP